MENRNSEYVKNRIESGLEDLMMQTQISNRDTDFTKSLHQIGMLFDNRSLKHRELLIITNAQNNKNYWNS